MPWINGSSGKEGKDNVWMINLPRKIFIGYNPFAIPNYTQVDEIEYWNLPELFSDERSRVFLQVRGLIFQDGRPLKQVTRLSDLFLNEGVFWVETNGLTIHIRPYDGINPNDTKWEITAREQFFAPEKYYLNYIRVKGFIMEYASNSFPFPQRGAISLMHGHHWIIENNTINWVNGVALDLGLHGSPYTSPPEPIGYDIVRGNAFNDIGICGVAGPNVNSVLIEDNVFHRNSWHNVEYIAECAAIKLHWTQNILIRRNIVLETLHGTGIYLDSGNINCRITQNVVANTGSYLGPGPGVGGIYIEASQNPNWIDNNFIWGSTGTNGIYCFFNSKVLVAHNLIGNCTGAGIMLLDVPGRPPRNPGGSNRISNNILVNNTWNIVLFSSNNEVDYNLFGNMLDEKNAFQMHLDASLQNLKKMDLQNWRKTYGFDQHSTIAAIEAKFNPETLELVLSVIGEVPLFPSIEGMNYDFFNHTRIGSTIAAGPFRSIPGQTISVTVDPQLAS
jgi:hypothetical protein